MDEVEWWIIVNGLEDAMEIIEAAGEGGTSLSTSSYLFRRQSVVDALNYARQMWADFDD